MRKSIFCSLVGGGGGGVGLWGAGKGLTKRFFLFYHIFLFTD